MDELLATLDTNNVTSLVIQATTLEKYDNCTEDPQFLSFVSPPGPGSAPTS